MELKFKCELCVVEITIYDDLKGSYVITRASQYPLDGYSKYIQALFVKQLDNTYKAFCKKHYKKAYKQICRIDEQN